MTRQSQIASVHTKRWSPIHPSQFLPMNFLSRLVFFIAVLLGTGTPLCADEREDLVNDANGHWRPGLDNPGFPDYRTVGQVERGVPAEGTGARQDAIVARLNKAYFDCGSELVFSKQGCTLYIRCRDPIGNWRHAFIAKRGSVESMNVNFFASQYPNRPSPEIAFEIRTDGGFGRTSFLVNEIDRTAWHDLVARYDGKRLDLICDGKLMSSTRHRGVLNKNSEPFLLGAWTDGPNTVFEHTGEIEEIAVWKKPLTDVEIALLVRQPKIERKPEPVRYKSPVHYRPDGLILADTIPFFRKGEYHIFYLRAGEGGTPWGHIVSKDLVHWKELRDALPLGKPEEADGENVFTGCVLEHNEAIHIFYTGWNPRLPIRETVMHAVSLDMVHWTKFRKDSFTADGVHYAKTPGPDFRDPYVFWNDEAHEFWMLLCARSQKDQAPVTGLAVSNDLVHWEQRPPVAAGYRLTPECPDMFEINGTWYLIVSPSENVTVYRTAKNPAGPWSQEPYVPLDTPILYAAKRMFDGRRHVLTGWLRDLEGDKDDGAYRWGGTQSIPREIAANEKGELIQKPVPEVVSVFSKTVFEWHPVVTTPQPKGPPKTDSQREAKNVRKIQGSETASTWSHEVPDNYLLDATVELDPKAECAIAFREGPGLEPGYQLVLMPEKGIVELRGEKFRFRRSLAVVPGKPIRVQAFVLGTTIECFINDEIALSARAYDHPTGRLGITVANGGVVVKSLEVKVAE